MTTKMRRFLTGPLLPVSALLAAFIITLGVFLLFKAPVDGRVFYYPVNSGESLGSERRGIPSRRTIEDQVGIYLQELLIGPVELELAPTAPKGTSLRHAAIIGKTAYVDLDLRMLDADRELTISFDEALENIRYNLVFNFPRLEDVVFTIEGQQVGAPFHK